MARRSALEGAYLKGVSARLADQALTDCPYEDKRKWSGRLTWSRAFQTAWCDGWNYADKRPRPGIDHSRALEALSIAQQNKTPGASGGFNNERKDTQESMKCCTGSTARNNA